MQVLATVERSAADLPVVDSFPSVLGDAPVSLLTDVELELPGEMEVEVEELVLELPGELSLEADVLATLL